ncbi:MAG: MATE family efflux transporter [Tenuifilaceae bacterium]|nr:MATE family efflux transporter [Tenuifilaceae bacterium]
MKTSISYSRVWSIAYPIIIGSVAQNVINVTDTAFLGHLGETALGGGAIGGLFYMTLIMLGWGFGVGTQIVVARRYGEEQYRPIGRTIEHGFLFLMTLALVIFLLVKLFGNQLLMYIVDSESIVNTSREFINYRIWGIFFAHTNFLFRAFYVGISRTRVITLTTIVMVLVNVFLDYSLMFGNFGFPEMGVGGAALASVIAEISCTLAFIAYTLLRVPIKKYRLFSFKVFSIRLLMRTLKVSIPMMLLNFISFSVWFIFFLIIEKRGESELAISNIVRSVYVILLIPIMGFSSATSSLVSYVIGKGRENEVLGTIGKILVLCVTGVLLIVIPCSIFPEQLLSIYTRDAHLISMGVPLIYIIAFSSVLLGFGNILFSGVSGTGKTNISLGIEIGALTLYVGYTALMVGYFNVSVTVAWTVEILYALLLSLLSYAYLKSNRWVGLRV